MSSKITTLLTSDNEHWYDDCSEPLTNSAGQWGGNVIVLEFDKSNIRIESNDDTDLVIHIINPDCDLYKLLNSREFRDATKHLRM